MQPAYHALNNVPCDAYHSELSVRTDSLVYYGIVIHIESSSKWSRHPYINYVTKKIDIPTITESVIA